MKTLITLVALLISASTSFAASGSQVNGDLTVAGGGIFHLNGSSIDTLNGLLRNKGAWVSGASYSAGDVVQSGGSSYVCKTANQDTDLANTSNWSVLATQGAKGDTGSQGIKGDTGAPACSNVKWLRVSETGSWDGSALQIYNQTNIYDATNGKITGWYYTSSSTSSVANSTSTLFGSCTSHDYNNYPTACSYYNGTQTITPTPSGTPRQYNVSFSYSYDSEQKITLRTKTTSDYYGTVVDITTTTYDSNENPISETRKNGSNVTYDILTYSNSYDASGHVVKSNVYHSASGYTNHVILYQNTKLCL